MKQCSASQAISAVTLLCCALSAAADQRSAQKSHHTKNANPAPQTASFAVADNLPTDMTITRDNALAQRPMQVCMPGADEDKPALRSDCITVLEDVSKRKGRYAATSRNKRELRSLCENQWLPRCRHKY